MHHLLSLRYARLILIALALYLMLVLCLASIPVVLLLKPIVVGPYWDYDATTQVISVEQLSPEVDANRLPEVRIWGNGRIVWVTWQQGIRTVQEGLLSPNDMQVLLQQMIDAELISATRQAHRLEDISIGTTMVVQLSGYNRTTVIIDEEATPEQQRLLTFLRNGAGATPHVYVPARGRIVAYSARKTSSSIPTSITGTWPAEQFGYDLSALDEKPRQATSEELAWLWDYINQHPDGFMMSDGTAYWVAVLVPGLSLVE